MNCEVWKYEEDTWKVFLEDKNVKEEISAWDGCRSHCSYYWRGSLQGWDVIVPQSQYNRVLQYLQNIKAKDN